MKIAVRLFTTDQAVEIVTEMFNEYVEPLAVSMMSGEVPSMVLTIHRYDTKESDWLAHATFKNTVTLSTFKCDVYLDDIYRLCRRCKLWLLTDEIFRVAALYYMLHPLYQTQYINFEIDINADYESMMAGSGKETYHFMKRFCALTTTLEQTVLDILEYRMMIFTNHYHGNETDVGHAYTDAIHQYAEIMKARYKGAYEVARYRKAQTYLVDADGFMILEPKTKGGLIEK